MTRYMDSPAPFCSYYSSLENICKMEIEKKVALPCRALWFLLGFVLVISAMDH